MPVTIDDVARTAGVSTATVSRALRGLPHVNETTRAAVHRIALDLGYVPSKSASTLASGRTRTVGVVTPHIAKWFFAQAIEALEKELHAVGYDVLLLALPPGRTAVRPVFDPEELRQRVGDILEGKTERIILIKADEDAQYSAVMGAMDALRSAGIEDMGLITDPKQRPGGGN